MRSGVLGRLTSGIAMETEAQPKEGGAGSVGARSQKLSIQQAGARVMAGVEESLL